MVDTRAGILTYAESFIGRPYIWGGDDPSGFDCSGFVVEVFQAFGLLEAKKDYTASDLFSLFSSFVRIEEPRPGDLAFWINAAGKAIHIEICCNSWQTIGASGSGRPKFNLLGEIDELIEALPALRPLLEKNVSKNLYTWLLEKALYIRQADLDAAYIRKRPLMIRPGAVILNPLFNLEN